MSCSYASSCGKEWPAVVDRAGRCEQVACGADVDVSIFVEGEDPREMHKKMAGAFDQAFAYHDCLRVVGRGAYLSSLCCQFPASLAG